MSKRIIDFESFQHPDPRLMAWIEANGLDPSQIPVTYPAVIEDGNLTVTEFLRVDGVKTLAEDGDGWKKTQRTVPLLSAPEDHGL